MNITRSNMNNFIILATRHIIIIISENIIKNWIKQQRAYWKMNGADLTKTVLQTDCRANGVADDDSLQRLTWTMDEP